MKNSDRFADILSTSSAAVHLIELLSDSHLRQFEEKCRQFQDVNDPAEAARLRDEIRQQLFGE